VRTMNLTREFKNDNLLTTMEVRKSVPALVALLVLVIAVIGIASLIGAMYPIQKSSNMRYPRASPPGVVFSVVWPVLYTLMALGLWLLLTASSSGMSADARVAKTVAIVFFLLQLGLNYAWMPTYNNGKGARQSLYILLGTLAATLVVCFASVGAGQWGASAALAPYVAWLVFALYLNADSVETVK